MPSHDSSEHLDKAEQPAQETAKVEQHDKQHPARREPPSPAARKRLQKCFEHASKQIGQENYDYAAELLTQCVVGDPGNRTYVQNYLDNLRKKYKNNKKGSPWAQFQRGSRSAAKKALSQEDWDGVIKNGLDALKVNPWDVPTLCAMATASAALAAIMPTETVGFGECELLYLKIALELNSKDPDVNRQLGIALGKKRLFDQAIAAWHRVEQAQPEDEEAKRAIATLAVEKTLVHGKFDDADSKRKAGAGGAVALKETQDEAPEDRLRKKIARDPNDVASYEELSQVYLNSDRFKEAVEVLTKVYKISKNDPDIKEKLDDAELRYLRHKMIVAERKFRETGSEEEKTLAKRLKKEIIGKELVLWKSRCERFPTNLNFKYELGLRYQLLGEFNEAIKEFQVARNDPRRKGLCLLELGKCFQQIQQFRLAMSHYQAAIEEIPDRDADNKKSALYRAGRLAYGLKDLEVAEKHLSVLAGMDFSFRDVSALLDKISRKRDDKGSGGEGGTTEDAEPQ